MKPTPQAIENAALKIRAARNKSITLVGEGTDYDRALAVAALSGDLGDMVLVPKEAMQYIAANSGERTIRDMARAMLAAAEDSNDQG